MLKLNRKSKMHTEDKAYIEWLQSKASLNYQRSCQNSFLTFLEFLKKQGWKNPSGDTLLTKHKENRKSDDNKVKFEIDDLIPKFIQWLEEKEKNPLDHNSAINTSVPIRGFFKYHREPLQVQQTSFTTYKEKVKSYHTFTQEELQKMVRVGDLEEKAVLLLGKDLGIRVGDFIRLKRSSILEAYKNQNGEFPIEFQIETEKEGVVAVGHVMQETWDILQDYWAVVPKSDYVFPSNGSYISEDKANYVIRDAWNRAYPDRKDVPVRFHELRSFKMTTLSDVGINEWHIKKMVGKKLSADVSTYLRGVNLKEDFRKAEQKLSLTGTSRNHARLEELEERNKKLEEQIIALDMALDIALKKLEQIDPKFKVKAEEMRKILASKRWQPNIKIPKSELEEIKREEQPTKEEA